jgi:hypothetical protein
MVSKGKFCGEICMRLWINRLLVSMSTNSRKTIYQRIRVIIQKFALFRTTKQIHLGFDGTTIIPIF